ncbi:MAG: ABC transporter permease [Acidobacteria bacterium]|nr:ABC transporter permease [Acidobacteriota bacterium]
MDALASDLRYAFRQLRKNPGFAAVAVASLALGIGANTAVFSWIDAILLRPLQGVDDRGLVAFETLPPSGESIDNSYPDFQDYRDHLRLLSGLAMAQPIALGLGDRDHVDRIWSEMVSGNYFAVLGVKPALGRTFLPEEYGDKPNGYPVAVISDALWHRRFQADPAIAGKVVLVNGHALTVVGVAPPEFHGTMPGLAFDIWVPTVMRPQLIGIAERMLRDRKTRDLHGIARLRPGVRLEQARAEIAGLAREMARANPHENGGISATVLPLGEAAGAQRLLRVPLQILMAACGALLLIICANLANLLLARAVGRRQELGVRVALGAGRARLARQLLTESLLLAALGAVLAVPLSLGLGRSLQSLLPRSGLPFFLSLRLNADVMAFTLLLAVATPLLAGLYPVLDAWRTGVHEALMEGGRGGSATLRTRRTRSLLVIGEVALALITLIGAGLFARTFESARRISPGFDADHVLVSQFYLDASGYSLAARKQFCLRLRERLRSSPGVTGVAYADSVPLGFAGGSWEDLKIEGYVPGRDENMKIIRNVVAPGFFDLLRVPVLDGRDFSEQDDEKALPVMIVNQAFAGRFLAHRQPLGRRVWGWGRRFTIVGVVKDSKYKEITESPLPYFFVPFRQVYREDRAVAFYLRTAGDPNAAVPALRREVRLLDPKVGVYDAMPLAEYIGAAVYPMKVAAILLGALGAWCLALAALGLYGVMAYTVGQRTHEVGIRMALGARPADVLRMVVGQAMLLVAGGLVAGVVAAAGLTRLIASALVGVGAGDPGVFLGAALMLVTVAALASFVPAQRAAGVDPVVALRQR